MIFSKCMKSVRVCTRKFCFSPRYANSKQPPLIRNRKQNFQGSLECNLGPKYFMVGSCSSFIWFKCYPSCEESIFYRYTIFVSSWHIVYFKRSEWSFQLTRRFSSTTKLKEDSACLASCLACNENLRTFRRRWFSELEHEQFMKVDLKENLNLHNKCIEFARSIMDQLWYLWMMQRKILHPPDGNLKMYMRLSSTRNMNLAKLKIGNW